MFVVAISFTPVDDPQTRQSCLKIVYGRETNCNNEHSFVTFCLFALSSRISSTCRIVDKSFDYIYIYIYIHTVPCRSFRSALNL